GRSGRSGETAAVALVAVALGGADGTLLTREERGEVGRGIRVAVRVDVEGDDARPGVVCDDAELAEAVRDLIVHIVDVGDDAADGDQRCERGEESDAAGEVKGQPHDGSE
ncbi:hypothetical protein PMAYCL1PPCAC_25096, partial [Pristionchus mayeri]